MKPRVLIIEDDPAFSGMLERLLAREQMDTTTATNPVAALKIYSDHKLEFDLVMLDYRFEGSDINGVDIARRIKKQNAHQALLFMTGYNESAIYREMLQTGAARNFIEKGGDPAQILAAVRRTLADIGFQPQTIDTLEDEIKRENEIRSIGLIGRSKALQAIVKLVKTYRRYRSRFLIVGASGAGKELVAKAFQIPGKPFYGIDCSQFSEGQDHLLESNLFGHKKGAFTGADSDKVGAFEFANGGVVFLDELHYLSLSAQSKLLRTLQEMKFRRMGDNAEISFDVTFVAATKPVIFEMLVEGTFIEDLYFRLARAVIEIPPLNERTADIRPLANYFVEKYSRKHGRTCDLHAQLLRELEAYSWTGNVRELECFIDKVVMVSPTNTIGPEQFRAYLQEKMMPRSRESIEPKADLKLVIDSVQSEQIIAALTKVRTVGEAASALKTARTTLADRMRRLGIDPRNHLARRG